MNIWAVLLATVLVFVLGGIWYSPKAFGALWVQEAGIVPDQCKKTHKPLVFIISFVLAFIAAVAFALFLGANPGFFYAVGMGLLVGICWVSTSFGVNYLFAGRSLKLLWIDGGYHVAQFFIYGVVLGIWH